MRIVAVSPCSLERSLFIQRLTSAEFAGDLTIGTNVSFGVEIAAHAPIKNVLLLVSNKFEENEIDKILYAPKPSQKILIFDKKSHIAIGKSIKYDFDSHAIIDEIPHLIDKKYLENSILKFKATAYEHIKKTQEKMIKTLSKREVEILKGVSEGKQYSQIAYELSLSEKTVAHYSLRAQRKLNAKTLPHAVALLYPAGL